jgi:predicted RNase H-like nuclease
MTTWVAGADGCPPGWAVVLRDVSGRKPAQLMVFATMAELLRFPMVPALLAIDMPMGLPESVGPGGRAPESELRQLLGERKASLFSIPSRRAIYGADFAAACAESLATSEPPRKISIQAYNLFPKIRELDALIRNDPGLASIMRESHPEGAFMVMNGNKPLDEPKKMKSAIHPPGIAQRKALLVDIAGFDAAFLDQKPPKGVGVDDFMDACACAFVAEKLALGTAVSFPQKPDRDAYDIPMAIWA